MQKFPLKGETLRELVSAPRRLVVARCCSALPSVSLGLLAMARAATVLVAASALGQFVNALAGLLIVRSLAVEEYSVYTLANALFSLGSVLATMSVPSAVLFALSRPSNAGSWAPIREGLRVANFLCVGAAGVLVLGAWFYREDLGDADALIVLIGIATSFVASRAHLWRAVAFAEGRAASVARVELLSAILRLLLLLVVLAMPLAEARVAMLLAVNALALAMVAWWLVRPLPREAADVKARRGIVKFVAPLVPEHVYFVVQGQLGLFLLAYFGSSASVAELGALTRLAVLITILSVLNNSVF